MRAWQTGGRLCLKRVNNTLSIRRKKCAALEKAAALGVFRLHFFFFFFSRLACGAAFPHIHINKLPSLVPISPFLFLQSLDSLIRRIYSFIVSHIPTSVIHISHSPSFFFLPPASSLVEFGNCSLEGTVKNPISMSVTLIRVPSALRVLMNVCVGFGGGVWVVPENVEEGNEGSFVMPVRK